MFLLKKLNKITIPYKAPKIPIQGIKIKKKEKAALA